MLPQHETKEKGFFLVLSRWLIYVVKFPSPRHKCPSTSLRPQKWPTMKMKNARKFSLVFVSCIFSQTWKQESSRLLEKRRRKNLVIPWDFPFELPVAKRKVFLVLGSNENRDWKNPKNLRSHIFECHCVPQVKVPPPILQPPNWWIIGL